MTAPIRVLVVDDHEIVRKGIRALLATKRDIKVVGEAGDGEAAVAQARLIGIARLYLESNSRLANAVHLYESAGFRHLLPERIRKSDYSRSNVYMELFL